MTDKSTPGPWEAYNLDNCGIFPSVYIGPPDNNGRRPRIHINEGPSPEMVEAGRNFGTTMETARANANLIAAAPDLLKLAEAIEWIDAPAHWTTDSYMCPWCRCGFQNGHAADCPRQAAIAKAGADGGGDK